MTFFLPNVELIFKPLPPEGFKKEIMLQSTLSRTCKGLNEGYDDVQGTPQGGGWGVLPQLCISIE
jgi:hypothetical protein